LIASGLRKKEPSGSPKKGYKRGEKAVYSAGKSRFFSVKDA
jgi:hypothetical protein